jgi:hypothetical protein
MDLNFETMEIVSKCLRIPFDFKKTEEYFHEVPEYSDFRFLANGKKDGSNFENTPKSLMTSMVLSLI